MQARYNGRCGMVLVLGACLLGARLATAGGLEVNKKQAVPSADAQAKVGKLIQELYADELAKAKEDRAVQARLAQTLLQEARDTADNAAGRYVLLQQSQRLAAAAGDAETALLAVEELAQGFAVPPAEALRLRVNTLTTAAAAVHASPTEYQAIVERALLLVDDTLLADDFASSLALLQAADRAALRLRQVGLVASIRKRLDEVHTLQDEYARWQPFVAKLAEDPADADANAKVGYYVGVIKGQWDKGVPLLARGTGPGALAAKLETQAGKTLEAGDQWVKFAATVTGLPRTNALLHAYQLYLHALPGAETGVRQAVESRLLAVNKELPAEYRAGEITAELRKFDLPSGPVYSSALSPDGRRLVVGAYDGSLRVLDTRSGKELGRLHGHLGKVWTVAFHPDGRHVVSGGFDGSVRLWDLATVREVKRFAGHTNYVRSVCVSADGQQILSGGDDRLLRLWDITTGKEIRVFKGHDHFVWQVALAPDGKHAASASLDKTVRLWQLETGANVKTLVGHHDTVLGIALAPDGRHALSASTDKTLILWDLELGKLVKTLTGHTGYVQSVAISPDGRFGMSGSADFSVRLWDLATGSELRVLDGHRDQVWSVAFSSDGRLGLSSGQDHCVRIWGRAH